MKFPFIALGLGISSLLNAQPTSPVAAGNASALKAPSTPATPPSAKFVKGTHFDELRIGDRVFQNVIVRDVTARSILISDTEGITSIPFREMPPDLQRAFGYQPALEAAAENRIVAATRESKTAQRVRQHAEGDEPKSNLAAKFQYLTNTFQFGVPPTIAPEVDLRPQFRNYGLGIKNQGRRPSCVVFAIVSAFEFENAEVSGRSEPLSEDYLIWATCQTLKRAPQLISPHQLAANVDEEDHDMGFSFRSVLESLRVFGLATQVDMPDSFVRYGNITAPTAELIRDSAMRRKLVVHYIPGLTNSIRIGNIIHVLNQGIPVPVAMYWPSNRLVRTGFLNTQPALPGAGHAVTLVGYRSSDGDLERTEFIFRNSYGPKWGQGGYGRVSFGYLSANLQAAVALEVQRPDAPGADVLAARGN